MKILAGVLLLVLATPAQAYWECDGVLTSNNVCIGSTSNVNSRDNHEAYETRRRDYFRPRLDVDRERDEYRPRQRRAVKP